MTQPRVPGLPVAIAGARGAYGQVAAQRFFGGPVPVLPCGNNEAAVAALSDGRAAHAVLSLENAITGPFAGLVEALFGTVGREAKGRVVGEVVLPIRHALFGLPGARLEELAVVTSHPSALAQCRDWLARWGVSTRPASDTAEAARKLAEGGDRGLGVLGSRELAATYGLELLAEGVSDRPNNQTRFIVLGMEEDGEAGANATRSAGLVGPSAPPRSLKTLRIQLESLGARRVRVPVVGAQDGERFLIEFDHAPGKGSELLERASEGLVVHYLGAWAPMSVPLARTG